MSASAIASDFICGFEGFSATPYRDSVGVPTIGFGSTFYLDGRRVTMSDPPITRNDALALMQSVLETKFLPGVLAIFKSADDLTDNQLAALLSFAYNLGVSALAGSTLAKKINAGDLAGAADEFLKWNRAGGIVLAGLTRRRTAERALFLQA